MGKRLKLFGAIAMLAVAALVAVGFATTRESDPDCASYKFNSVAWRSLSASPPTPRQKQADLLVACEVLEAKSASEVLDMLGPADERGTESLAFQLGPERGPIRMDSEYLYLELRGSRVVDAYLENG